MLFNYHRLAIDTQQAYADLDDDAKEHPLEYVGDVIRFKTNPAVRWMVDRCGLNELSIAAQLQGWDPEAMNEVYRLIGYSLDGYLDVRETAEAKL